MINALRGVALLVDATHDSPPKNVVDLVNALKQDPVADVRSNVAALKTKIERVESSNVSPTSVQKPAG